MIEGRQPPRRIKRVENPLAQAAWEVLTPEQVQRLRNWNQSRRAQIKRLWARKGGRKLAIHMTCLDCCGEDSQAVGQCGDRCCPLWHFRPFQHHKQ